MSPALWRPLALCVCWVLLALGCAKFGVVEIIEQDGAVQKVQSVESGKTRIWYRQYEPATRGWYAVEKDPATGAWRYTHQGKWDLDADKRDQSSPSPSKEAASAGTAPSASPAALAAPETAREKVELIARGATWIKVAVDGAPPKERYVQDDERVTLGFEKSLTLAVGAPDLVRIQYKGKTYSGDLQPGQTLSFPPGF